MIKMPKTENKNKERFLREVWNAGTKRGDFQKQLKMNSEKGLAQTYRCDSYIDGKAWPPTEEDKHADRTTKAKRPLLGSRQNKMRQQRTLRKTVQKIRQGHEHNDYDEKRRTVRLRLLAVQFPQLQDEPCWLLRAVRESTASIRLSWHCPPVLHLRL